MPRILAFDASSTNVGYCLGDSGQYFTSGVFSPKGKAHDRVTQIAFWTIQIITETRPEAIAIEEPAGDHGNRKTDRLLAGVWWSIYTVAVLQGIRRVIRVWPSQVKKTKIHKGTTRQAALYAGKPKVGEDEADAIGVWLAAEAKLNVELLKKRAKEQA